MKQIKHKELTYLVKRVYNKNTALFCWGTTGIGKSETIRKTAEELAKENERVYIDWNKINNIEKHNLLKDENIEKVFILADIRASNLDISDLKGLPNFNGDTKEYVDWKPILLFKVLSNPNARGILFFDEVNLAPPIIQSSLYSIILDKTIGELSFGEGIVSIACGNRIEDRGNIFEMGSPLANRFIHVELAIPTITEFTDYCLNNKVDGRIIGFLNFKPSRLFHFDSKEKDKSFPTPRMWIFLNRLIDGISDLEELELISSSAIGEATAIEFSAFVKLQRKIDIKDLLNNPEKIKEIKEIDLKYSLLSSANEYYKLNKKKEILEKVFRLCNYLEIEFGVLLLRMCKSIDEDFFRKGVREVGEGKQLIKDYARYII